MVDTTDSKSVALYGRAGSSPARGTISMIYFLMDEIDLAFFSNDQFAHGCIFG